MSSQDFHSRPINERCDLNMAAFSQACLRTMATTPANATTAYAHQNIKFNPDGSETIQEFKDRYLVSHNTCYPIGTPVQRAHFMACLGQSLRVLYDRHMTTQLATHDSMAVPDTLDKICAIMQAFVKSRRGEPITLVSAADSLHLAPTHASLTLGTQPAAQTLQIRNQGQLCLVHRVPGHSTAECNTHLADTSWPLPSRDGHTTHAHSLTKATSLLSKRARPLPNGDSLTTHTEHMTTTPQLMQLMFHSHRTPQRSGHKRLEPFRQPPPPTSAPTRCL